jgi:signal peptidase I
MKSLKFLFSAAQTLLLIVMIAVVIATFGTRIPLLSRWGVNLFAVTSGSMEPKIPTGAIVSVMKIPPEEVKEQDIITYQKKGPNDSKPTVVTHRVVKVTKQEDERTIKTSEGKEEKKTVVLYTFKTKGDANSSEDAYDVSAGEVIGRYQWHVPYLGYVTSFAQTQWGFLLLVVLPAALLIMWEVSSVVNHFRKKYKVEAEKEIERLKAELAKQDKKDE